jgi:glycosyltransferase involved in cell wall biosynthesis
MEIAIIQPLVGSVGGNFKVFDNIVEILHNHEITLFTFSKPNRSFPSNVTVKITIPRNFPLLGIYQKWLMPKINYSKYDLVISATGSIIQTTKPLIIYDQNHLANYFTVEPPLKYQKGLWWLYYLPFKLFSKKPKITSTTKYLSISQYSSNALYKASGIISEVLPPPINLTEFYCNDKQNQVCVIGRISPEKNLEQTIAILNQIDYPCFIFGNVTTPNVQYLKKLKSIASNNITFIINEPREKLLELLSQSKIFFSASSETFGIATVEGIASGCVPIIPNNSANKEVVPVIGCRYNSNLEAIYLINSIMDSTNELKMDILSLHIKDYNYNSFEKKFSYIVNTLTK